jgi:hypothetical protein
VIQELRNQIILFCILLKILVHLANCSEYVFAIMKAVSFVEPFNSVCLNSAPQLIAAETRRTELTPDSSLAIDAT